jgi:hypothetical protein
VTYIDKDTTFPLHVNVKHFVQIGHKNCIIPAIWKLKAQIMKLTMLYANKWAKIAHGVDLPLPPATLRTETHVR